MYSWYFGEIDRKAAESALERDKIDGCFVVRDPSERKYKELGFYSLSVWDRDQVMHVWIRCDSDNKYSVNDKYVFESVAELIEFYKTSPFHYDLLLICSPSCLA